MNKYFGTANHKNGRLAHARNITLGSVRSAILHNKSLMLGTSNPEKWHTILRKEFPDVKLRIVDGGVLINEKS